MAVTGVPVGPSSRVSICWVAVSAREAHRRRRVLSCSEISQCMRGHGVSEFPDPRAAPPPSTLTGYSLILGMGGYILAIPSSMESEFAGVSSAPRRHAALGLGPLISFRRRAAALPNLAAPPDITRSG